MIRIGLIYSVTFLIGTIFNDSFVALMPGLQWIPASGPEKGGEESSPETVDYFDFEYEFRLTYRLEFNTYCVLSCRNS